MLRIDPLELVDVMLEHGISRVLSYDRRFDGIAGIERLEP